MKKHLFIVVILDIDPKDSPLTKERLHKILTKWGEWWPIWENPDGKWSVTRRAKETKLEQHQLSKDIIEAVWRNAGEYVDMRVHSWQYPAGKISAATGSELVVHTDIFDYDEFVTT